jgi:hypothetical protein
VENEWQAKMRQEFGRGQQEAVRKRNPGIHPKTKENHEESSQPNNLYREKKHCELQQWTHPLFVDFGGS